MDNNGLNGQIWTKWTDGVALLCPLSSHPSCLIAPTLPHKKALKVSKIAIHSLVIAVARNVFYGLLLK